MKPKVFIASSVEGLDIAYPIQGNIQHDADVTVWSQGVFSLSDTSLDSLINILDASDFGIFVFSPDDEVKMRGNVSDSVRDNVLFELGLFIGRLGKRRCFIVKPDNINMHIPSDLIGVTPATYSGERDISEISASLGPACHEIRRAMKTHGCLDSSEPKKIPANEFDQYDENDKVTILESWLLTSTNIDGVALRYIDIDNELKLEVGTTKRLLEQVVQRVEGFRIDNRGSNVFRLLFDSHFGLY
ncbi:TIR domain-containing protein [Endozoicomonas sp.]|uniref:TIR domain-containing protein n=1 Tax=Endozoicomonas sp. TaxID=1892382 RepID=UPI00383AF831